MRILLVYSSERNEETTHATSLSLEYRTMCGMDWKELGRVGRAIRMPNRMKPGGDRPIASNKTGSHEVIGFPGHRRPKRLPMHESSL